MRIERINIPAAGTEKKDCELMCLIRYKGLKIVYQLDGDESYWRLECWRIVAYKSVNKESSATAYLINMPENGPFFEVFDSPWIREFGEEQDRILSKSKHYVLRFRSKTIEIIAQDFIFEKLKEKPIIVC